jgi:hypothetical protein
MLSALFRPHAFPWPQLGLNHKISQMIAGTYYHLREVCAAHLKPSRLDNVQQIQGCDLQNGALGSGQSLMTTLNPCHPCHPQPRAAKHSASKEFQPKSNSSNWWFSAMLCTHSSPVLVQGSGSRALYARKSCENTLWKHESLICTLVLHQPEIWTSFKRRKKYTWHYLTTSHRETTKKHVTITGSVTQSPPQNWLRVVSNHFWVPLGGT